jgi:hypothetical protein
MTAAAPGLATSVLMFAKLRSPVTDVVAGSAGAVTAAMSPLWSFSSNSLSVVPMSFTAWL